MPVDAIQKSALYSLYLSLITRMKLFSCILSLYLLMLTAFPCIDSPKDNSMPDTELSQTPLADHQSNSELCSPFCVCDCCISPIIYQDCTIQINFFSHSQNHLFTFIPLPVHSLHLSIWQPPKLSQYSKFYNPFYFEYSGSWNAVITSIQLLSHLCHDRENHSVFN